MIQLRNTTAGYMCKMTNTLRDYCEVQANGRVDMFQEASDLPQEPPGCSCSWVSEKEGGMTLPPRV